MRLSFVCTIACLCLVTGPLAWAKSKKLAPSQPHMNGVEYLILQDHETNGVPMDRTSKVDPEEEDAVEVPEKPAANNKKMKPEAAPPRPPCPMAIEEPETRPVTPPTIVIDAGHGGKDPGAAGTFGKGKKKTSVREKDVVLQIAKQLAAALKKRLGAQVTFTRPGDTFVTLGERDRIATRRRADLFLSVHANASKNQEAQGLEIYYLNKATDEASRRLAARENEGAPQKEQAIEEILSDLQQTAATEESSVLAAEVEKSFRRKIVDKYDVDRLNVKTALFYVLVGAKCPSLLIETGFVTNPEEGRRLKQVAYQRDLAGAIAEAVAQYWSASKERGSDL
jgi:N-acetylmuramoyl-L-alanine amidase